MKATAPLAAARSVVVPPARAGTFSSGSAVTPRRGHRAAVTAAALGGLMLGCVGCMGKPPKLVMVEPTYALEQTADADALVRASWPVMPADGALVDATPGQRGFVAELAFLER